MKIAYITAGAGDMYCGSCLRDNTLAAAFLQAGHEVLLLPVYTPTRTDEHSVSTDRVFLGGINVYLQQHFRFFRGTPRFFDRLLDIPALLRFTTQWGIRVDPAHLGRLTVSMLRGMKGFQRKEVLRLVRFLADEIQPEIINLPNSLLISLAPALKAELKTPVCCTLQGEDLFLEGLGEPFHREALELIREHAASVDAFIAVSEFGARSMAGYLGIEPERMHVAPLGINFDGHTMKRGASEPFTIGYLARIAPEKGLHVLCNAYRVLRSHRNLPASRLWAAGYLGPEHRPYLKGIRDNLDSWGLAAEFSYHGVLDRINKLRYLQDLDVFSVPGPYDEPKGLFLLEAMASGLPVVQPRRGAFREIVENTGGGILVEPDNPEALAQGLQDLWMNPEKRAELGAKGYRGVRAGYSSAQMAEKVLAVYRLLLNR